MKTLDEMTPQEEQEYIDKINEYFRYCIDIIPFVEIGHEPDMRSRKLRSHVHEGKYSVPEILFELQRELHFRKLNNPEKNIEKLIVSELELTPHIFDPNCFCPVRGIMIKMKYITNENLI
jgi:hypothetical protein